MTRESKLVELRGMTDRDLLILVKRELNRGLAFADVAATNESPFFDQAESAHQSVRTWLPLVWGLSRYERRELESRLQELQSALDRLTAKAMRRHLAASSAA